MNKKDRIIYDKLTSILAPKPKKRHVHLWDGAEGIETCYECGKRGYRTAKGRMRVIQEE